MPATTGSVIIYLFISVLTSKKGETLWPKEYLELLPR
jgi:hypothetical protein